MIIEEDKLVGLAIAYKVEKFDDIDMTYPLKEGGRILFVPIAIAKKGKRLYCFRRFVHWIKEHSSELDEIVYEKNDSLVRKKIGDKNGKKQGITITSSADVLSELECQPQY